MISFLVGKIAFKEPPVLVVEVKGVGYEVQASMNTFYQLPEVGAEIKLLTQLIVREDAHLLYGFISADEKLLFNTLIKVNGVGPKLGLTILSSMTPPEFVQCVMRNDLAALVRMPGVGKKTAERLVIEMRDRLKDWGLASTAEAGIEQLPEMASSAIQDAIGALIALGYKPQDASRSVKKVAKPELSREALIRQALQQIS